MLQHILQHSIEKKYLKKGFFKLHFCLQDLLTYWICQLFSLSKTHISRNSCCMLLQRCIWSFIVKNQYFVERLIHCLKTYSRNCQKYYRNKWCRHKTENTSQRHLPPFLHFFIINVKLCSWKVSWILHC